jgi:hypothetical protein
LLKIADLAKTLEMSVVIVRLALHPDKDDVWSGDLERYWILAILQAINRLSSEVLVNASAASGI